MTWEDPRGFDDEDYVINPVIEGSQQRSTAASFADGDFFVAWDSERESGNTRLDVRGRIFPAGYRIPLAYPSP